MNRMLWLSYQSSYVLNRLNFWGIYFSYDEVNAQPVWKASVVVTKNYEENCLLMMMTNKNSGWWFVTVSQSESALKGQSQNVSSVSYFEGFTLHGSCVIQCVLPGLQTDASWGRWLQQQWLMGNCWNIIMYERRRELYTNFLILNCMNKLRMMLLFWKDC